MVELPTSLHYFHRHGLSGVVAAARQVQEGVGGCGGV